MQKIVLIFIWCSCLNLGYSQFDRIITEPILENPSYVGYHGGEKLMGEAFIQKDIRSSHFFEYKSKSKLSLSYDKFNKDLGGWGVNITQNQLLKSNELSLKGAYSPKISLNEKSTWAPSLGVQINYRIQKNLKPFYTTPDSIDYTNHKLRLTGSILGGLTRNTKRNLQGISFSFDPFTGLFENKADIYFKFNRRKKNDFSSTLGIKHHFIAIGSVEIFEGHTDLDTGFEFDVMSLSPSKMEFLGASYWVKYKKINVGIEFRNRIWEGDKKPLGGRSGRQTGDFSTFNETTLSAFYNFKKIKLGARYVYSGTDDTITFYYENITNNDGSISSGFSTNSYYSHRLQLSFQWEIPQKTYKANYKR